MLDPAAAANSDDRIAMVVAYHTDGIEVTQIDNGIARYKRGAPGVQRPEHAHLTAGMASENRKHFGFRMRRIDVSRRKTNVRPEVSDGSREHRSKDVLTVPNVWSHTRAKYSLHSVIGSTSGSSTA